jgi:hypothetical protein
VKQELLKVSGTDSSGNVKSTVHAEHYLIPRHEMTQRWRRSQPTGTDEQSRQVQVEQDALSVPDYAKQRPRLFYLYIKIHKARVPGTYMSTAMSRKKPSSDCNKECWPIRR